MKQALFLVLLNFVFMISFAQKGTLERIEPPFWWNGFQDKNLQLMVYGKNIAQTNPSIFTPGIELIKARTTDSPDYLFLDLKLTDALQAGNFPISFSVDGKVVAEYLYEIRERIGFTRPVIQEVPPVFVSTSSVSYYQIREKYKENGQFFLLADTLHQQGIKVIMELSLQTGQGHEWVSRRPMSNWLIIQKTSRTASFQLNLKTPLIPRYLIQNCIWWIEQFHPDAICIKDLPETEKGFTDMLSNAIQSEYAGFPVNNGCNLP